MIIIFIIIIIIIGYWIVKNGIDINQTSRSFKSSVLFNPNWYKNKNQ